MRLKIKPVQPSPVLLKNQQSHVFAMATPPPPPPAAPAPAPAQDEALNKTTIVKQEEGQGYGGGWPPNPEGNHNINKSDPEDNNPPELSPSVDQSLGKRKRKPKELIDEISPILFRKKKKKPSVPKSALAITDGGKKLSSKREKAADDGSGNPIIKSPTLIRAEEVQSSLGNEHPSFVKLLVRSHVASCFWMGLPVPFCKTHLPRKDGIVVLENENGERFEIKYISEKTGLSAGWRKFVAAHKLVEGDVLIFQLIGPTTFKVLVIRANDLTEVDGALSLLNLDTLAKQSDAIADGTMDIKNKKKRRPKSLPLTVVQKKKQKGSGMHHSGQLGEHSGNDSDEVASEVLEGSKLSADAVRFRDVKTFEDFRIMVNGACIDSELPDHVRRKYFELCCSKNALLHEGVIPGLHCKLAAGMIFECISAADAIKACKVTTPRDEFEKWEKSLMSFKLLGMNVEFLIERLHRLLSLAFDFEGALETKRYWEARSERDSNEGEMRNLIAEMRNLEDKLMELKQMAEKQDAEIEALQSRAENYEMMFQEEVNAPW